MNKTEKVLKPVIDLTKDGQAQLTIINMESQTEQMKSEIITENEAISRAKGFKEISGSIYDIEVYDHQENFVKRVK